jgi:hypothetical protein
MEVLAEQSGLVDAMDQYPHVLKADSVLGVAYDVLCAGRSLQGIELWLSLTSHGPGYQLQLRRVLYPGPKALCTERV